MRNGEQPLGRPFLIQHSPFLISREALYADVLLAAPGALLALTGEMWGGIVWRIGGRALDPHPPGAARADAGGADAWGGVHAPTGGGGAGPGAPRPRRPRA